MGIEKGGKNGPRAEAALTSIATIRCGDSEKY